MLLNKKEMNSLFSEFEVDYEEHTEFMHLVYKRCYKEINTFVKNPLDIDFEIKLSPNSINASASEDKKMLVGVEYSLYLLANKFFNTVFSKANSKFYELITYEKNFDEENAKYWSVFMKKLTLEIIIFHELGHIYGGNVVKCGKSKAYVEENCSANEENDIMFYQAREVDADRFAAYNLVAYYVSDWKIACCKKDFNIEFKGKQHVLIVLLYASILAFSFLGAGRDSTDMKIDYKKVDHFPNRYRGCCYYYDMVEAYNYNYPDDKVKILCESDVVKIIESVETWFDYYMRDVIEVTNWSPENNRDVFDEEHKAYYTKVNKYMQTIFINEINAQREGLARIKEVYVSTEELFSRIAAQDGGETFYI